ncbi:hypothetical protein BKE38_09355 [Pseudoroseomonas deserti]|uniref:Flagellar protein FlgN n=1 Tax=Teichococcus deserti TaxID=1817963 RepID=A0A1V2H5N2_9PROT|nr:hypothetical protein [Pseudoroseomonas deserti]ONG55257.1 hypothetical protein BKE38_09355 [Pseudoroseomonas deserti]
MSALLQAAARLQRALQQEAAAARQVALPALHGLIEEKRQALAALTAALGAEGLPRDEAERAALRAMMRAAEENAMVLGAVAGALEGLRERLRHDLQQAADPGLYGPAEGPRRRPLRHTLAASLDRTA